MLFESRVCHQLYNNHDFNILIVDPSQYQIEEN
jgi:hypothetical protein